MPVIIQHLSVTAIWSASLCLPYPVLAFRVGGTAKKPAGNYELFNIPEKKNIKIHLVLFGSEDTMKYKLQVANVWQEAWC